MTERERQLMEDFDLFEMGVLGTEEAAEMRHALAESGELRAAFLSRDASDLLLGYSLREQQPSREARENFLREVRNSQPVQLQMKNERDTPRPGFGWQGWPAWSFATLAVLLAITTAILLMQNAQYRQTNQLQAAQLATQEQQLAQAQTEAQTAAATNATDANAILSVLQASDTARFVLTKAAAKPQPQIKTYFRRSTGQVLLVASNLPPAPAGKIYELWLVPSKGGAPLAAGLFRPDSQGNISAQITQTAAGSDAKAFAVTLEPEGGSPVGTPPILFSGAQGG